MENPGGMELSLLWFVIGGLSTYPRRTPTEACCFREEPGRAKNICCLF